MTVSTRSSEISMAESPYRKRATTSEPPPTDTTDGSDELLLARRVAYGLPIVTFVAAIAVGVLSSAGPAILVLVAGAILGTIAALWASVRTLAGDAPIDPSLLALTRVATSSVLERKARVLRALKDLEHEHSIGKIDEADYEALSAQYRADAKKVLREIDAELGPNMARAEEIVQKHLEKRGFTVDAEGRREVRPKPPVVDAPDATVDDEEDAADAEDAVGEDATKRRACPKCEASNEVDAAFCKSCGAKMRAEKSAKKDAEPAPKVDTKPVAEEEDDEDDEDDAHRDDNDDDEKD
jgi:hypothetical protein